MTNFIYNMQDELFHLNMILPVGEFSPIKKLVDHIEAQGKQLRELNATITKRNKTIEKYEREKKELQNSVAYLRKKVNELNAGIRDSEDLTWKQKYEALLHSSEQAIGALQKKCQEYKNSESDAITSTIETLVKENKELEEKNKKLERANLDLGDTIGLYVEEFKKLKAENKDLLEAKKIIEKRCREAEKALEMEKQISNNKISELDEYMTKYNNLERNYKEEVRMKEQFKMTCFRYEVEVNKLKRNNAILSGKVKEISNLAESIVMLCDDEE